VKDRNPGRKLGTPIPFADEVFWMNRSSRVAAIAGALAVVLGTTLPAAAQYATEYAAPKLVTRGTTSSGIGGAGTVVVQVQVNADGSHKVIRIIHSTREANNQAALDIADSSTYKSATRGGKPVTAFYDYTLKFTDVGTAAGPVGHTPLATITRMNTAGNYKGATASAKAYLAAHPGDARVNEQLGIAEYFQNDFEDAAAAFTQVPTISKSYRALAAHAYASAATSLATDTPPDPTRAAAYARKALAIDSGANSQFALGIAQLSGRDFVNATASLLKARNLAFADKRTDVKSKVNLDTVLMEAYADNGDFASAQKTADEIKQLDPTSTAGARVLGNAYLNQGFASMKAAKYDDALKQFDQAAAIGDPQVQVTAYAYGALSISSTAKPDYTLMKTYADKALAVKSDDAMANFAEGIALTGQYQSNKKPDIKASAVDYCNKALGYAKAASAESLVLQIQSFMKTNLK
jgi:tetratricopeptide (TPR) repeat protein